MINSASHDGSDNKLRRERTALRRVACSRPIALALSDGIITTDTSTFDYGCGYGADVRYLRTRKINATGWDPFHHPNSEFLPSDVINLGYVLNVIEDLEERAETLRQAYSLAKRVLIVAVRVERALADASVFGDGVVTRRDTFQKIYTQDEFLNFLESVLGCRPYTAAIGIAYVFKNQEAADQYIAARAFTRRLEYRTDLVEEFSKSKLARRYVSLASRLGRLPLPEEFPKLDQLLEVFGSPQRVNRLALRHIDYEAFSGSQGQRREDILTYFSMMRLQGLKPPPLLKLPISVQADIKEIWKTYRTALAESERYLFSLGNSEVIQKACAASPVGKHLPSHIYVHQSAEDELPALLRIVIFAAKQIVGEVPYNVAKIAVDGRTVSFLDYPNFDQDPHPALLRSVQVYLPKTSFNIRDYSQGDNPPILHRKDTFVTKTYPYFEKFRKLTVQEEGEGLLSNSEIGFKQTWENLLRSRNLCIINHELHPLETMTNHLDLETSR